MPHRSFFLFLSTMPSPRLVPVLAALLVLLAAAGSAHAAPVACGKHKYMACAAGSTLTADAKGEACSCCPGGDASKGCTPAVVCDVAFCTDCYDNNLCGACDAGYYVFNNGCVNQCAPSCVGCEGYAAVCTQCSQGYKNKMPLPWTCEKVDCPVANCLNCGDDHTCTACAPGYVGAQCTKIDCSAAVPNCGACSSTTACQECAAGYVFNAGNTACEKVVCDDPDYCELCSQGDTCVKCIDGFKVNPVSRSCVQSNAASRYSGAWVALITALALFAVSAAM